MLAQPFLLRPQHQLVPTGSLLREVGWAGQRRRSSCYTQQVDWLCPELRSPMHSRILLVLCRPQVAVQATEPGGQLAVTLNGCSRLIGPSEQNISTSTWAIFRRPQTLQTPLDCQSVP